MPEEEALGTLDAPSESLAFKKEGDCLIQSEIPPQVTLKKDKTLGQQCSHIRVSGHLYIPKKHWRGNAHACQKWRCLENLCHLLWLLRLLKQWSLKSNCLGMSCWEKEKGEAWWQQRRVISWKEIPHSRRRNQWRQWQIKVWSALWPELLSYTYLWPSI